jgi:hydroxymethylpyrimidine pyrophosphatase-like HAD family hydrolase
MTKLVVFDLDGTLAQSKSPLNAEMATMLSALLRIVKVAVISGGNDHPANQAAVTSIYRESRRSQTRHRKDHCLPE